MVKPVRSTPQMQQEQISRHQLSERLTAFGWQLTSPSPDLGEDFVVHIYFEGRATGVMFHVQEKSVTNLNDRRKDDYLVYKDIAVKDLIHWEEFRLPVVLIIWDIHLREGRWALINDIIADLDQRLPDWRRKKAKEPKVSVRLPWQNTTDDAGLVKLRQQVGQRLFPIIAKDRDLRIRVDGSFPDTQEDSTFAPEFPPLVDKLCVIQDKTRHFLRIPPEGLTPQDVRAISEITEIIEHGKFSSIYSEVIVTLAGQALALLLDACRQDKRVYVGTFHEKSFVELLGETIQLGRMMRCMYGRIAMSVEELERASETLDPDESLKVTLVDLEVVEIFPDWFIREAERLSQQLVKNFGVEAIYLFGSLAWGDIFTPETDIDLAVAGLPAARYLEALSFLERISDFPIDLVDLNNVSEEFSRRIVTEGKLLYERASIAATG